MHKQLTEGAFAQDAKGRLATFASDCACHLLKIGPTIHQQFCLNEVR